MEIPRVLDAGPKTQVPDALAVSWPELLRGESHFLTVGLDNPICLFKKRRKEKKRKRLVTGSLQALLGSKILGPRWPRQPEAAGRLLMFRPCPWHSSSVMLMILGPPRSFEAKPRDHELLRPSPHFPTQEIISGHTLGSGATTSPALRTKLSINTRSQGAGLMAEWEGDPRLCGFWQCLLWAGQHFPSCSSK